MNKIMEHQIRKSPFIGLNQAEREFINSEIHSETPMIIREMMIYNRHLIEENIMLRTEIKQLETQNSNLNIALSVESNITKDEILPFPLFNSINDLALFAQANPESETQPISPVPVKKVKMQKKGTQLQIDPAIGTMFSRQLKDSGYSLSDVCRAMMLIAIDRPRYRNMILDRVKQSERISNTQRETLSFAFQYPVELGEKFIALIRSHNVKQYEFFEQMFKEFIHSYSFRKLLPDYINQIKKNKI
jgi:hypothetical protein